MFLGGTPSSIIMPPSQLSKVRDLSCAEELCEVVYPDFCSLDGALILSLLSPCSQVSATPIRLQSAQQATAYRSSFEVQHGMCQVYSDDEYFHSKYPFIPKTDLIGNPVVGSWQKHISSSTIPSEMKCAPCSPYSGEVDRS